MREWLTQTALVVALASTSACITSDQLDQPPPGGSEPSFLIEQNGDAQSNNPFNQQSSTDNNVFVENTQNFGNDPQLNSDDIGANFVQENPPSPQQDSEQPADQAASENGEAQIFFDDAQFPSNQVSESTTTANEPSTQNTVPSPADEQFSTEPEIKDFTVSAKLWWIGLNLQKARALARVELVTVGSPNFDFIQGETTDDHTTLIVRFYETSLRPKLQRPLDATEFRSPIAFIHAKEDVTMGHVDVAIALREPINPKVFADDGNVLLTFALSEKYLDQGTIGNQEVETVKMAKDFLFSPLVLADSTKPKAAYVPDVTDGAFEQAPADHGSELDAGSSSNPTSFETEPVPNTNEQTPSDEGEQGLDNGLGQILIPEGAAIVHEYALLTVAQANFADDEQDFDNSDLDALFDAPPNQATDTGLQQNSENLFGNNNSNLGEDPEEIVDSTEVQEVQGSDRAEDLPNSQFPPVNIEFKDAALNDVIRALSLENDANFIFPETIGDRKVTMTLNDVPWDQALEAVLETHSLGLTKLKGNVIRIDTLDTLEKEKKRLEGVRRSAALLIPTKVLVVRLSYASAEAAQKIIEDLLPAKQYDSRVRVRADQRTNSIIVEAIPEDLEKIRALVQRIDLQTPQVKISTRVIEVLKDVQKFLGINWGGSQEFNQGRGLGFGNLAFPHNMQSIFSVDTGAQSATQSGQWDINFGSINNAIELDLRLRMAELNNYTRGLQNSTVIVLDNEQAMIQAGSIDYFQVPTGNGENQLSQVDYTLLLEVTPQVTADGAIQMKIKVENGSPKEVTTNSATSKNIRSINTNMLRQNGETAVIGGLYTTLVRKSTRGIPILQDIPIIGALFRSKAHAEDKRELMIMVTPTVLNSEKALSGEAYFGGGDSLVNNSQTTNQASNELAVQNPAADSNLISNQNQSFNDLQSNQFNQGDQISQDEFADDNQEFAEDDNFSEDDDDNFDDNELQQELQNGQGEENDLDGF